MYAILNTSMYVQCTVYGCQSTNVIIPQELKILNDEKAKVSSENAHLAGHNNPNQKIWTPQSTIFGQKSRVWSLDFCFFGFW